MQIIRYTTSYKAQWDSFVDTSKNGTFLLKRDFMEYHSDRFEDCSFMFFIKNKLQAIIPGNIDIANKIYYSHQGLTYGGFLLSYEISSIQVLDCMEKLLSELTFTYNIKQIIYKAIPAIYHKYPAEEDLYVLFRYNARIIERKISSTIKLSNPLPFKQSRREGIRKAIKEKLEIVRNNDFTSFWQILEDVLRTKHHTTPVHSLEEITLLKKRFPDSIHLFEVKEKEETKAGCVMFDTQQATHVQYIATSENGKKNGALDFLFNYLINHHYPSLTNYFDFGVSVEKGGTILNEGLIFQKEGFGGRGIMYDTYMIEI